MEAYPSGVTTVPHTTTGYLFAPLPEALIYDPNISHLAVRVYAALMRHGLDPASCYPSHKRIAALIGVSERSVQRPLKDLEEAGWISIVARFNERGDQSSNGYMVHVAAQVSAPGTRENVPPGAQVSAGPGAQVSATNESHVNESQMERGLALVAPEPPKPKRATSFPEQFFITDAMVQWAHTNAPNIDLRAETAQFCDYHRARGDRMKDWTAAWRTWMRNAVKFAAQRGQRATTRAQRNHQAIDNVVQLASQDGQAALPL